MLNAVATFLLVPPLNLLLLALVGFVLSWQRPRWQRAGRILCGLGLAGLLLLAMPITNTLMLLAIEDIAPPPPPDAPAAIVILGGDVQLVGNLPSVADVGAMTLERLRAGAALQRAALLPVLVSGGVIDWNGVQPSLATMMTHSLETDFAVPVRWQESASLDTWENARDSGAILQAAGIRSVFLVTHAWHMRRALIAFRHFGIEVTPAPVPFSRLLRADPGAFIPRATSWADSYHVLHEWVGCVWYALRAGW